MTRPEAARTACLMQGMAERLGARLPDGGALGGMVAACRSCTKPDECILWLVDHAAGAAAAPGFCLNGERLEMLCD